MGTGETVRGRGRELDATLCRTDEFSKDCGGERAWGLHCLQVSGLANTWLYASRKIFYAMRIFFYPLVLAPGSFAAAAATAASLCQWSVIAAFHFFLAVLPSDLILPSFTSSRGAAAMDSQPQLQEQDGRQPAGRR